ncbi:hypothetical protein [Actinocorallia sp. A-T 12471]|uniref:hypothetical protein n=1 Tax=Actinocorallia sp. A-T 12471 TaxID=3089813 RepID=UPI0029D3557A|nr:hypothetical protein [Actinocorallia sp. A-T 12471]MDX6743924.1 hypothetical protein [Actinocorallia sp. A-T 12471]
MVLGSFSPDGRRLGVLFKPRTGDDRFLRYRSVVFDTRTGKPVDLPDTLTRAGILYQSDGTAIARVGTPDDDSRPKTFHLLDADLNERETIPEPPALAPLTWLGQFPG